MEKLNDDYLLINTCNFFNEFQDTKKDAEDYNEFWECMGDVKFTSNFMAIMMSKYIAMRTGEERYCKLLQTIHKIKTADRRVFNDPIKQELTSIIYLIFFFHQ